VRDCGVIGYPDEDAGEVPCAFIALSEDAKARVEKDQGEIEKSELCFEAWSLVRHGHCIAPC
jgi:acyl-coenzyme A synthetase/AMP-(fatty) acid ligase